MKEERCRICNKPMEKVPIPCPDELPCAVYHFKFQCKECEPVKINLEV